VLRSSPSLLFALVAPLVALTSRAAAAETAAPTAAPPPAADVAWRPGVMPLPFIGLNSFQGDSVQNLDWGLRLGTIFGYRFSRHWSAGAELAVDFVRARNLDASDHLSEHVIDLAVSPLLHVPQRRFEVVLGPVLGPFSYSQHRSSGPQTSIDTSAYGWTFGGNLGVLFTIDGSTKLGLLASAVVRTAGELHFSCTEPVGGPAVACAHGDFPAGTVLGLAAAAML
jgi:hypothetical protein